MSSLLRDLRIALRLLGRQPTLAALTVLSLGLGIGANTTVFSIINSLILRPLPVEAPDRLVAVYTSGGGGGLYGGCSFADFMDYRAADDVFSDGMAYVWAPLTLGNERGAERIWAQVVTPNYFSMLGVEAAHGRTFASSRDLRAPGAPEVVLGHGFWRRELGADPNVAGKTLRLNDNLFTVVGVAPEDFQGTEMTRIPELWVSSSSGVDLTLGAFSPDNRGLRVLAVIGRLEKGVSLERAQSRLASIAQRLAETFPETNEGRRASLVAANRARVHPFVRDSVTSYLGLLMGLVGLLLLVACGNLASLLLVRGLGRQPEVAVRMAVGASRPSLVRQFLVESVLLAFLGGVVGLLFALWSTRILSTIRPPEPFPIALSMSPDLRVLGFTLLLAFLVGSLFGLAPALRTTRPEITSELKDQLPVGHGRRSRLLNVFVVLQVAFSVILLITAGLFLRSLKKVNEVDLGFDPGNVLVASFQLGPMSGYTPEQGVQFYENLLERVRALPGVSTASVTSLVPMDFGGLRGAAYAQGMAVDPDQPPLESDLSVVDPSFFSTMKIPVLSGRVFGPQDTQSSPPVVIINQQLARMLWGDADVIGRRLVLFTPDGPAYEVVGITRTGRYHSVREDPTPLVYIPLAQFSEPMMSLVVRTKENPRALVSAVRNEVRALDPDLPAFNIRTLEEQIATSLFAERVAALLSTALALLALIQAGVGIYGVLVYSVGQRTREIGLRMALGAQPKAVQGLVVGQAMRLTWAGIFAGLAGAWMVSRLMAAFLFQVSAADPATYLSIPLIVAAFALIASYIPVRRASRVSPIIALKNG
ncbi:MAG TPA: ABC transporter permease [Thermoanaerobaculia bacterium]